jgi:hypothetical protein
MVRTLLIRSGVVLVALVLVTTVTIEHVQIVQARQAPVAAATTEVPDADDQLLLSTLNDLAVVATQACQAQPAVKQFDAQRDRIRARLEAKHPGYVIDFEKWTLVPKPAAKPAG